MRTKKTWGELSGRWVAHDTRDNVIDFIKRLSALGKALKPINNRDQDVLYPAIAQLIHDL